MRMIVGQRDTNGEGSQRNERMLVFVAACNSCDQELAIMGTDLDLLHH
ncbi:MAG TPA: hypothetical protein VIM30_10555 [Candidatus Limnocylindrales bacterium]